MVNKIADDLWEVTPGFMKRGLETFPKEGRLWYIRCQVLGAILDDVKTAINQIRRFRFIVTCDDFDMLKLIGKKKSLIAFEEETLSEYRSRLIQSFTFWSDSGTLFGSRESIKKLGFTDVTFDERITGSSDYDIIVDDVLGLSAAKSFNLFLVATLTKPAHKTLRDIVIKILDIVVLVEVTISSTNVIKGDEFFDDPESVNFDDASSWNFADPGSRKRLNIANLKSFSVGTGTPSTQTALQAQSGGNFNIGVNTFETGDIASLICTIPKSAGDLGTLTEIGFRDFNSNMVITFSITGAHKGLDNKIEFTFKITVT